MSYKLRQRIRIIRIAATLCSVGWLSISIYLWNVLGDRGLNADATHTSGYTTVPEIVMMVSAVAFFIVAFLLFAKAQNLADAPKNASNASDKESQIHGAKKAR